jgi:hypothetical protein
MVELLSSFSFFLFCQASTLGQAHGEGIAQYERGLAVQKVKGQGFELWF